MEQSHTIRYLVSILKGRKCSTLDLQIKNIKLHIVTDIKVTINSLSAFGFRYLGGGEGFCKQRKVIVVLLLCTEPHQSGAGTSSSYVVSGRFELYSVTE